MNNQLKILLGKYQNISLNILKLTYDEEYDSMEALINERQAIINNINNLDYTKDEFINIAKELKIEELEFKINKLLQLKKEQSKKQMEDFITSKNANNNYKKNYSIDSLFFNKKV